MDTGLCRVRRGEYDTAGSNSLGFALTFNHWYKMEDDSKTFLNWYHNYSNPK